ncbi:hypothetical protein PV648_27740, partial [Streptomyces sp. ID05-47C]|nr:hypothetical protein [Streptomyces sp. ID05-47C]
MATTLAMASVVAMAVTLTGCARPAGPAAPPGRGATDRMLPAEPTGEEPYRRWGLTAPLAVAPRPGGAA